MARKTIYIIRHAEGYHNLPPSVDVPIPVDLHDPSLTPLGESQCATLNSSLVSSSPLPVDLIVTSPIRRTLQTTLRVFDGHPTLKEKGALVFQDVQEAADLNCNIGTSLPKLKEEFAPSKIGDIQFDFSLLPSDDSWIPKTGFYAPTPEALTLRAAAVREWLSKREEEKIAIVSHGAILHFLIEDWSDHCLESGTGFKNCEFR
ncbi:phosphoglycerate mutase-like protein, partial [Atractiella rhizophila]